MAAIKQLEDSITDPALLDEEAEWFQTWKTSGIHQEVYGVPYYSQLDSLTGYGYRECFDAAAAMVVGFHHGINGSSRTGTMAQAEKAAKGYGITTKQFTDILSKVRKNNTFFGKPKNEKFTVDFLARKQFRDNESAGGANSMGLETDVNAQQSIQNALSGKTPPSLSPSVGTSVSTSQGAVGSTGGLGGGYSFGENNDSDGPDSSASTSLLKAGRNLPSSFSSFMYVAMFCFFNSCL